MQSRLPLSQRPRRSSPVQVQGPVRDLAAPLLAPLVGGQACLRRAGAGMDVAGHSLSQLPSLGLVQVAMHQHFDVNVAKDISKVPCMGQLWLVNQRKDLEKESGARRSTAWQQHDGGCPWQTSWQDARIACAQGAAQPVCRLTQRAGASTL